MDAAVAEECDRTRRARGWGGRWGSGRWRRCDRRRRGATASSTDQREHGNEAHAGYLALAVCRCATCGVRTTLVRHSGDGTASRAAVQRHTRTRPCRVRLSCAAGEQNDGGASPRRDATMATMISHGVASVDDRMHERGVAHLAAHRHERSALSPDLVGTLERIAIERASSVGYGRRGSSGFTAMNLDAALIDEAARARVAVCHIDDATPRPYEQTCEELTTHERGGSIACAGSSTRTVSGVCVDACGVR